MSTQPACDLSILIPVNSRPGHLNLVLAGIAALDLPPAPFQAEVVVRHTGTEMPVRDVVQAWQARAPFQQARAPFQQARAPFQADSPWRLVYDHDPVDSRNRSENRNAAILLSTGARLVFLDADCIPVRDFLTGHLRLLAPGHFVCGDALRLDEAFCAALTPERIAAEDPRTWIAATVRADQTRRHGRVSRHLKLGNMFKIPLQGGNFSCWRADLLAINGFDRHFAGWGQEDSDLGARLFLAGKIPVNGVGLATALHIWHPPLDRPAQWKEGPNVGYFLRPGRMVRCRHGLAAREHGSIACAVTVAPGAAAAAHRAALEERLRHAGFGLVQLPAEADWVLHLCDRPAAPRTTPHQIGVVLSAAAPRLLQRLFAARSHLAGLRGASWWFLAGADPAAAQAAVPERFRGQIGATAAALGTPIWFDSLLAWLDQIG
ncbi:MAG: galactosyltransferase-related protein [Planctomycetota bacterium]